MLPWKTIFKIDKAKPRAIYLQISDQIIAEVNNGRINKGFKMPGSRTLAETIGINRKTIIQSYDELTSQGWIEVVPSKGTFVKKTLPTMVALPIKDSFSHDQSTIFDKSQIKREGKVIDDGSPDYRLAPIDLLLKTARSVIKGNIGKSVLRENHSFGEPLLLNQLSGYLSNTRGIPNSTDHLLITRGSQMAIFLTFSTLLKPGDNVLAGGLNYRSADQVIAQLGANKIPIRICDIGLDLDHIEHELQNKRVKAIYITPHHQYPTTVTMPVEARLRLLKLADQYDFYILEDDYDYDYHYNRSPTLPLASIDRNGRVIYIGSFSKILVPNMRLGYLYASPTLVRSFHNLRVLIDRVGDPIMERALAYLIKEKDIDRYLKKTVFQYKIRRDLFCQILNDSLSNELSFDIPEGGMAIWVTFQKVQIETLISQCSTNGLALRIESYPSVPNSCRLGFASMNEQEIRVNLKIFIESVNQILK